MAGLPDGVDYSSMLWALAWEIVQATFNRQALKANQLDTLTMTNMVIRVYSALREIEPIDKSEFDQEFQPYFKKP